MKEVEYKESNTIMRFKMQFVYNKELITHVFRACNLQDLTTQLQDKFPGAKVLSCIGGGVE